MDKRGKLVSTPRLRSLLGNVQSLYISYISQDHGTSISDCCSRIAWAQSLRPQSIEISCVPLKDSIAWAQCVQVSRLSELILEPWTGAGREACLLGPWLSVIASAAPTLRKVRLQGFYDSNPMPVRMPQFPRLRELVLESVRFGKDQALYGLVHEAPRLQVLSVAGPHHLEFCRLAFDEARPFQQLEHFDVDFDLADAFSQNQCDNLASLFLALKELDIAPGNRQGSRDVDLANLPPDLTSLKLHYKGLHRDKTGRDSLLLQLLIASNAWLPKLRYLLISEMGSEGQAIKSAIRKACTLRNIKIHM